MSELFSLVHFGFFLIRNNYVQACGHIHGQFTDTIFELVRLWGINPANSVFIPQSLVMRCIVVC